MFASTSVLTRPTPLATSYRMAVSRGGCTVVLCRLEGNKINEDLGTTSAVHHLTRTKVNPEQ